MEDFNTTDCVELFTFSVSIYAIRVHISLILDGWKIEANIESLLLILSL